MEVREGEGEGERKYDAFKNKQREMGGTWTLILHFPNPQLKASFSSCHPQYQYQYRHHHLHYLPDWQL